jgi:hypothetical protein
VPEPTDAAERDRARLLQAWEASPLAKTNFCALKGMTPTEFDARIEQAQRERTARRGR